jgi:hypothetical protein
VLRHRLHGTGDAMTDLRQAADLALQALDIWEDGLTDPCANFGWRFAFIGKEAQEALRQALAQEEKPPVKSYCGGKPNYCTPEVTPDVDAVSTSQEPVDEPEKREHEEKNT